MKLSPKKFSTKILLSGITGAFLLFLTSTQFALADDSGIASSIISAIGSTVIGSICYDIGYIISAVFGILIAIEAWALGIVLNINANALQSTIVQNGFSISLSIANLAFVLGIIVIAIATILRRESYGIKQLLWKLVMMAVLVNFGLVIMAPIFGIGNSLTQYFINCISPASGGCSGTGSGLTSYNNFAQTFTAAFNPQNPLQALSNAKNEISNSGTGINSSAGISTTNTLPVGAGAGAFSIGATVAQQVVPIFGVFFLVINIVLIFIVLAVLGILLIIRYLYITILAILLPFAWAAYVFPSFSSHFESWWKKFLQWTFFPVITMFFIYLAMQSMAVGGTNANLVAQYATANGSASGSVVDTLWKPIADFLGGAFSTLIASFLQEIILAGLIIGGLIAADSMSVKFAGTAVDTITAGAGYLAAQQGAKALRRGWHAAGGHGVSQRLAGSRIRVLSNLGKTMQKAQTNKGHVDKAEKDIAHETKEQWIKNNNSGMSEEEMVARVARGIKENWVAKDTVINGRRAGDIVDDEALLERSGRHKLKEEADDYLMSNTNLRNGSRAKEKAQATAMVAEDIKDDDGKVVRDSRGIEMKKGAMVPTEELITAAGEQISREWRQKNAAKTNPNAVFGVKSTSAEQELQNVQLKALAYNIGLLPTMLKSMKPPTIKNINVKLPSIIIEEKRIQTAKIATISADPTLTADEKATKIDEIRRVIKGLDDTNKGLRNMLLRHRISSAGGGTGGSGGADPAAH